MDGAAGAKLLGHRLPLTARRQNVQDATDDIPHRQPWAAAFATRVVNGEHQIEPFPQGVGDLVNFDADFSAIDTPPCSFRMNDPSNCMSRANGHMYSIRIGS